MSGQTTTERYIPSMDAGRIYVRALLDQDGRACEEEHEAYAKRLVDQYYNDNDDARKVVRVGLVADLDGHLAGLAAGQRDGLEIARHLMAPERGKASAGREGEAACGSSTWNRA